MSAYVYVYTTRGRRARNLPATAKIPECAPSPRLIRRYTNSGILPCLLILPHALCSQRWAHNVRLDVDAQGYLTQVTADAEPQGCIRLHGDAVPGMPNLHSHAFQRAMAGLAEVAGNPQDSFWTGAI